MQELDWVVPYLGAMTKGFKTTPPCWVRIQYQPLFFLSQKGLKAFQVLQEPSTVIHLWEDLRRSATTGCGSPHGARGDPLKAGPARVLVGLVLFNSFG